ncbi:MAG: hypothetical protein Q4D14_03940 [Bacteroidales bacterium]|nr:hypothetical protein [Bacteroidales bacterium]
MQNSDKTLLKHHRKLLGVLCALLAPLCLLFGLFGWNTNNPEWYYSISATYYTNSQMLMIGLLVSTSVYFFSYRGYDFLDRLLTTLSAISALGIVAFPCKCAGCPDFVGLFSIPSGVSHIIHSVFAAVLFTSFALMILIQFTKGKDNPTPQKLKRDRVYRICGWTIVAFELSQAVTALVGIRWFTVINEAVMLLAFSVAWLVKGEAFKALNDVEA